MDFKGFVGAAREQIVSEALGVLRRCIAPASTDPGRTGLVVGQVQSGKTLSFTTLTALARDNGYPLVVVVAGTSRLLSGQSRDRLVKDLRLASGTGVANFRPRKWKHFHDPSTRNPGPDIIANTIAEWNDPEVPEHERQTVLLTVMKGHQRLNALIQLLGRLDLASCPAIVIDDEADQAGLNTMVRVPDTSTTYDRLLELRAALPRHSFLQYTATPQAPLLINTIDTLSPTFAEVLTPGDGYVGGRDFFVANRELVRRIPSADVPSAANVLQAPPESLLDALRLFFIGVAAGMIRDNSQGSRSMLVHPSQETNPHAEYLRWVTGAKNRWHEVLALPEADPDRIDLLEDFEGAYRDIAQTQADLPAWTELRGRLRHAIQRTFVREVNSARGRQPVDWDVVYSQILVGGQAMDRGFTVEGLTVTYMPRGIGVGNADTVQQRARFFGYKREYLGYCRVFLEQGTQDAFTSYVQHEEHMRNALVTHRATGRPLGEWKRAFLLDPALRPTRVEVLGLDYMRHDYRDAWYTQLAVLDSDPLLASNRDAVRLFLSRLGGQLVEDVGDRRRTDAQRHLFYANAPGEAVLELLAQWRLGNADESQRLTGLRLQLEAILREAAVPCDFYVMSRARDPRACRTRSVRDATITYLHQGANAASGYPGDSAVGDAARVRVQVHYLTLTRDGLTVVTDVPAIGVFIPNAGTAVALTQLQGNY